MKKKDKNNGVEASNKNYEVKKMNTSGNSKKNKNITLPWWIEFLFVQIGLPDKLLIKILKTNKKAKDFFKNEKKSLTTFFLLFITFAYFYPVIKHSKNKLDCESIAQNYIVKNKNITGLDKRNLKMLSTNFCYGGEEIYEIENLKN